MILTQDTLLNYFTPANSDNSWYDEPTNIYNFVSRDSNNLLVTVGDSWTWGSDISENNLDEELRIKSVWGNCLSKNLKCDWLNLALCAQGNQWMANRCTEFYNIVPHLKYKTITLICVFTGAGRMFNTDIDREFDYIEWFKNNNIQDLLLMLNKKCVETILDKPDNVDVYLTSNMVDALGYKQSFSPWYTVLGFNDSTQVYTDMTAIKKLLQVEEFLKGNNKLLFKEWMLETLTKVEYREKWYKSPIFRNQHPIAEYHKKWAMFIKEQL